MLFLFTLEGACKTSFNCCLFANCLQISVGRIREKENGQFMLPTIYMVLDTRSFRKKTQTSPVKLRVTFERETVDYQTVFGLKNEQEFAKLSQKHISAELVAVRDSLNKLEVDAKEYAKTLDPFSFPEFDLGYIRPNKLFKKRLLKAVPTLQQDDVNFNYEPYLKRFPILMEQHPTLDSISVVYVSTIKPLILISREQNTYGEVLVRTKAGQTRQAISSLQQLCRQLNPAFPITYQFAAAEYQNLYKNEVVISKLSNYFAGMAILISCLGLLGLAMFTAEQRTKEIGIRKVLGASTGGLFTLLALDFVWLVALAFLIAAPIAGWALQRWLEDYSYHTHLSSGVFIIAGSLAFIIAMATISYHAIRVALANPVKNLRAE
jgi:hypothetical protein